MGRRRRGLRRRPRPADHVPSHHVTAPTWRVLPTTGTHLAWGTDSQRCADCLMGTAEGMRAYSMDLRERVVAAVDRGMTQEQAAVTFGVSVNTVGRYLTRRRNTGSLAPTAYRHGPRPEKTQRLQAWLPARLQVAADATLTEHAAAFTAEEGLVVSLATMSRAIPTLPADDPAEALTPAGRRRRPGRPVKSTV